jgi:hypothetical protein
MKLETAVREQWQTWQTHCDLFHRVFLDETGLFTDMTPPWTCETALIVVDAALAGIGANAPLLKIIEVQDIIEAQSATFKYLAVLT